MKTKFLVVSIEPIDCILDANIPRKVKIYLENNRLSERPQRILHIGDVNTRMGDEEILRMMSKAKCLLVTYDQNLASRSIKNFYRTLCIKGRKNPEEIVACIIKNYYILASGSIFCYNNKPCEKCGNDYNPEI